MRRIALVAWLIAALAALAFDPADPWRHPTWVMTMGGLIGLAAMLLSIAFALAPRPRPPTTGSDV